jgi:cytochrome P450
LRLIQNRREAAVKPDDLLTLLLAAQDEETGIGMSDQQLRDETMTLLSAGHETTGAALAWTWYLLGRHPEIQEEVFAEVGGHLRGRSPNADDLPHLPLTRAVFEETMRLYPPAWGIPRQAIADDEIHGFAIRRGAIISLPQYLTHRHPDFWPEPEKFQPDRFLGKQSEGRPKYAYYPFGAGPRICIGNTFALMEATVALATIAQHFRIELVPGQTVLPDPTFTLRPKGAVNVMMWPR